MIRNTRDEIAKVIAKEKDLELIQAQEIIELFLQLAYKKGYIIIKQTNNNKKAL